MVLLHVIRVKLKTTLEPWIGEIRKIAVGLKPFLPETAEKIERQFLFSVKSLFQLNLFIIFIILFLKP